MPQCPREQRACSKWLRASGHLIDVVVDGGGDNVDVFSGRLDVYFDFRFRYI